MNEAKQLTDFLAGMGAALKLDAGLPLSVIAILIVIARENAVGRGCTVKEAARILQLPETSVFRGFQRLAGGSKGSRNVGEGLGMIYYEPDPLESRRHLAFVSEVGRAFIAAFCRF